MPVTKERWAELCRLAARERDPEKLAKLNNEINSILQSASNGSLEAQREKEKAARA